MSGNPTPKQEAARPDTATTGPVYRSGAAARLAGLPVETLRVWERRHDVVGRRVGAQGQRRYTAEQVKRLRLIKQLVDLGNPISTLAGLPDQTLAEMQTTSRALQPTRPNASTRWMEPIRVVLVGESFAGSGAFDLSRHAALETVATWPDLVAAAQARDEIIADVLVVDSPALLDDAIAAVASAQRAVGATAAVVLYRFGQRETIQRLRKQGCVVARMPLDLSEVETLCRAARAACSERTHGGALRAEASNAARFDESALDELARASSTVFCECPRHLVDLLRTLGSFERYSAECEHRSPEDAQLHQHLKDTAGKARALLEEALLRVAIEEGIALPRSARENTR